MSHINVIWTIQKIDIWNVFFVCGNIWQMFPIHAPCNSWNNYHELRGRNVRIEFLVQPATVYMVQSVFESSYIKKGHNQIFCFKAKSFDYLSLVTIIGHMVCHIAVSNLEIIYLTWNMYKCAGNVLQPLDIHLLFCHRQSWAQNF